ncbi:ImmA/IrrE family metallo-endopeptidase [Macrococcus bovicus]|uniref:ImmA/IrrE family metallo-endopeptidase n=1 Tax=Macrococcus bovicus TaxID=69968 RepID=UPI0025A5ACED|nr:ImmA/IrrE family metallo-endopeptidase [Macrococcus bovicus]WJP97781.1 ImmA/IrrE family metallo-endopeptidase [Macrococcus bovicus]
MSKHKLTPKEKFECIEEIKPIVKKFKTQYGITEPISDSFKKIENDIGYFIVSKKVNNELSGFQYKIGEQGFIFVNNNHDLGRQNQSLWHEVYHLYTGDGEPISKGSLIKYSTSEFKADQFASRILIDRDYLSSYIRENKLIEKGYFSKEEVLKMQNIFNVSFNSMCYTLNELYDGSIHGSYYTFGSIKKREAFLKFVESEGYDQKLSQIPEEDYISPIIFEILQKNLADKRTSSRRVEEILDYIYEELRFVNE